MRVTVTGGCGFVGGHIAEYLASQGDDVTLFDVANPDDHFPAGSKIIYRHGDIRNLNELLDAFAGMDEVYNLAGMLGTSEMNFSNSRAVEINVTGCVNVLEACLRCGVKRVFHPTKPNDWLNSYSITKYASEQFCLMYRQLHGMRISVLRFMNAFGTAQHAYPVRKVVPTLVLQALQGWPLTIFGSGEQTVDLIYVNDIAKISVACMRMDKNSKVMDAGAGVSITINELAGMIIGLAGSSSTVAHLPMRVGEPEGTRIQANTKDLVEALDYRLTPLEEGMVKTIGYYRAIPESTRDMILGRLAKTVSAASV